MKQEVEINDEKSIPLIDGFTCPFCGIVLEKREMQFHVAIPLCMKIRVEKTPSETIEGAYPAICTTVPKIDLEYYGQAGIRKLLKYMLERCAFGHPDADKPVDLESFVDHSEISEDSFEVDDDTSQKEKEFRRRLPAFINNVVKHFKKKSEKELDNKEENRIGTK